jgi:hypothetical protein
MLAIPAPIRATEGGNPFTDPASIYEVKYDGYRCTARQAPGSPPNCARRAASSGSHRLALAGFCLGLAREHNRLHSLNGSETRLEASGLSVRSVWPNELCPAPGPIPLSRNQSRAWVRTHCPLLRRPGRTGRRRARIEAARATKVFGCRTNKGNQHGICETPLRKDAEVGTAEVVTTPSVHARADTAPVTHDSSARNPHQNRRRSGLPHRGGNSRPGDRPRARHARAIGC